MLGKMKPVCLKFKTNMLVTAIPSKTILFLVSKPIFMLKDFFFLLQEAIKRNNKQKVLKLQANVRKR